MSQPVLVRVGMGIGIMCTILAAVMILFQIQPAIGAFLALIAGLGFTIGTAAEVVQKWEQFEYRSHPIWLSGIRFVFTLLGACFAPWLVIAIITLIRRML